MLPNPPGERAHPYGIEFGWRVHAAQEAWTGKVDIKASVLLALQTGILVAVVAGHGVDGVFEDLRGWRRVFELAGGGLELVAVAMAASAIFPLLGKAIDHAREHDDNLIYFGHLRHWDPDVLAARLSTITPAEETAQLSRQLVRMSSRNWAKHRLLQGSVLASLIAVGLIATAVLWPN